MEFYEKMIEKKRSDPDWISAHPVDYFSSSELTIGCLVDVILEMGNNYRRPKIEDSKVFWRPCINPNACGHALEGENGV
jgi:hypothetical protein